MHIIYQKYIIELYVQFPKNTPNSPVTQSTYSNYHNAHTNILTKKPNTIHKPNHTKSNNSY